MERKHWLCWSRLNTIRRYNIDNITFRDENISVKKIDEAIKLSNLEDILKNSSEGLSTVTGERGINLSGVKSKE